jgi:hypothetical protein
MGEKVIVALAFCTFLLGLVGLAVGARLVLRWRGLGIVDAFCGVAMVSL